MRLFYFFGGPIPSREASSVHVMKMCQAFARNGHDVTLLTSDWPESEEDVGDPFAFTGWSAVSLCEKCRAWRESEGTS